MGSKLTLDGRQVNPSKATATLATRREKRYQHSPSPSGSFTRVFGESTRATKPQGAVRDALSGADVLYGPPVMLKKEYGMNANELRDKTPDQLREELVNLKKESFNLRFQQATGQLENTAGIRAARRNAAKVKTILNEKAAAAASEA